MQLSESGILSDRDHRELATSYLAPLSLHCARARPEPSANPLAAHRPPVVVATPSVRLETDSVRSSAAWLSGTDEKLPQVRSPPTTVAKPFAREPESELAGQSTVKGAKWPSEPIRLSDTHDIQLKFSLPPQRANPKPAAKTPESASDARANPNSQKLWLRERISETLNAIPDTLHQQWAKQRPSETPSQQLEAHSKQLEAHSKQLEAHSKQLEALDRSSLAQGPLFSEISQQVLKELHQDAAERRGNVLAERSGNVQAER